MTIRIYFFECFDVDFIKIEGRERKHIKREKHKKTQLMCEEKRKVWLGYIFQVDDKPVITLLLVQYEIYFSRSDFSIFSSPKGSENMTKNQNSKNISHIVLGIVR